MIRWIPAALAVLALGCQPPPPHEGVDPVLSRIAEQIADGRIDEAREAADRRGVRLREGADGIQLAVILELREGIAPASLRPSSLARHGARLESTSRSWARAAVPPHRLGDLASQPDVRLVRAPAVHLPADYGSTVSQAVGLTGADELLDAGYTGAGVKVAVVDGGFEGLTEAIDDHGELPAGALAYQGGTPRTWADIEVIDPHGVGVAEHVLDMAPGVDLYCILVEDEVDFENAADLASAEGIHVVNHSMAWFGMSYYDDSGPISGIVNDSRDLDGVFWAASAGNGAAGHWRGAWSDGGDALLDFDGADHEMELTTDSYQISLVLNWDQYDYPDTDLDLFLYASDGSLVASSEYDQPTYVPAEGISAAFDGDDSPYQVVVQHMDGPTHDLDITLSSYFNHVEHAVPSSSLVEPAESHGAFAVGAIDHGDWDDGSPSVTGYSAQGPTNDGRLKPDLVSPDGTECWTYGAAHGTSFSSPTTAGAAALLLEADPGLDAVAVGHTLRALAEDQGDTGWDNVYGAGQLALEVDICIDADCDGHSDYDADGDGHDSDQYDGEDCADDDPDVHPDQDEICDDEIDNDCDGLVDMDDGDCLTGDDDDSAAADDDDVTADDDDQTDDDDDVQHDDDDVTDGDSGEDGCACDADGGRARASSATSLLALILVLRRRRMT